MDAKGYNPLEKVININERIEQSISFNIERKVPPTGAVVVNSQPENATLLFVSLDGSMRFSGSNGDQVKVPVGRWDLFVEADGFYSERLTVRVMAGSYQELSVNLTPILLTGSVLVFAGSEGMIRFE